MNLKAHTNSPKKPSLRSELAGRVLEKILEGQWIPGERIPTLKDLAEEFTVSYDTIQMVLSQLRRDGFLISRGRRGTFISDNPPHLNQYGLVFTGNPNGHNWSRFHDALISVQDSITKQNGIRIRNYFDIHSRPRPDETADLLGDLRRHCLRGLIYIHNDWIVEPLLESNNLQIPCVGISTHSSDQSRVLPQVWPNADGLLDLALSELKKCGRRRIGLIALGDAQDQAITRAVDTANKHGMELRPEWFQCTHEGSGVATRQSVHLLMSLPCRERPDGLIITDDNMIEHANEGLVRSSVRVGADVDIIAHANFPEIVHSPFPLIYIGFDVREILETCINTLEQSMNNNGTYDTNQYKTNIISPITKQQYINKYHSNHGESQNDSIKWPIEMQ